MQFPTAVFCGTEINEYKIVLSSYTQLDGGMLNNVVFASPEMLIDSWMNGGWSFF